MMLGSSCLGSGPRGCVSTFGGRRPVAGRRIHISPNEIIINPSVSAVIVLFLVRHARVESRRGKALNDLGGATRVQHPVMLTIIRIFLAYWFGFSILFMILSLVMVGPVSIYNTVGLRFLAAIILTLIQRWRR